MALVVIKYKQLLRLLLCFEVVSGLNVNLTKSEVVLVRNVPNVESIANILQCKISQLPMKYMDLSLSAPFKSKSFWDEVLEKMEQKLAS